MNDGIARSYAMALFEIGCEKDCLLEYKTQVNEIASTLSDDLLSLLCHPKIAKNEKKDVLEKVYGGKIDLYLYNFMKVVIDKNRFRHIHSIFDEFISLVNEHLNIAVASVSSAVALDEVQQKKITEVLAKRLNQQVECRFKVDESLLAGLRIKVDDQVFDNSALNRLERLKDDVVNTVLK